MNPVYKRGERVKINVILALLILAPLKLFAGPYDQEIEKYATQYMLDSDMVKAVTQVESGYRKNATSKAGAKGLMQIMPATWKEWAGKCDIQDPEIFNPDHNIHVGCAYLAWCIEHAGDVKKGLIAYNRGLTRGRQENWEVDWYYKKIIKVWLNDQRNGRILELGMAVGFILALAAGCYIFGEK